MAGHPSDPSAADSPPVPGPSAPGPSIEVGVVVKPHGTRGQLKVHLHNPESADARSSQGLSLQLPSGETLSAVEFVGDGGGLAIYRGPDLRHRDQAERWRGARLMLARAAVTVEEGQYLYADLIGCTVREQQCVLGTVADVFEAGASDVLVVRDGQLERMIPLVGQWVVSVDLEAREIQVVGADQWEPQPV